MGRGGGKYLSARNRGEGGNLSAGYLALSVIFCKIK